MMVDRAKILLRERAPYRVEEPLAYKGINVYYLDRFPCDTNVILTLVGAVPDHKKMNQRISQATAPK